MRSKGMVQRDPPAFIPEADESKYPVRGYAAEQVGFVPEGYVAEDVLSGKVHQDRVAAAARDGLEEIAPFGEPRRRGRPRKE